MSRLPAMKRTLLAALLVSASSVAWAQAQTTAAGRVEQVFASTNRASELYENPTGAFQPLESLAVDLKHDSMVVITYSVRGTVAPGPLTPMVFVKCEFDGVPCEPNHNSIQFLFPQFCCDARTYTWVVHAATKGAHTVTIHWGMGNATLAVITNRTLVVQAARQ